MKLMGDDINILIKYKAIERNVFPERLKLLMEKEGLSQSLLARKIGVSPTAINKYLKGVYMPKFKQLEKLAEVLKVSVLWLQGYDTSDLIPKPNQMGTYNILKQAEAGNITLENDDEVFERELVQEKIELAEKIELITADEIFTLNQRFYELISLDKDDWELLIKFNMLRDEGKKKLLGYAEDLNLIDKYCKEGCFVKLGEE